MEDIVQGYVCDLVLNVEEVEIGVGVGVGVGVEFSQWEDCKLKKVVLSTVPTPQTRQFTMELS
jgi:hypothetical protein